MTEPLKHEKKRDLLYDLAAAHGGYFSVREAAQVDLTTPYLNHYRKRGQIVPAFRGVYRLVNFPPGDHEELVVVWLATDGEAVFSHETALQLHGLSDLLPNRIHVSLPRTWQRRLLPDGVERHYIPAPLAERSWIGDVPATTPLRTLADCAKTHVAPEFVLQAIRQALSRGLIDQGAADVLAQKYDTTKI